MSALAADGRRCAADGNRLKLLKDRLRRRDLGKGELLVALDGETVVGHIYLWWERAKEPELRERLPRVPLIMNLWVPEERRRQGIGTYLVREAEDWLRNRGHTKVALGVDPANTEAVRLYLGLEYDPWPYEDIETHRLEFSGRVRVRVPEVCAILVRDL